MEILATALTLHMRSMLVPYLHDGLEEPGVSLAHALTEGGAGSNLEGQHAGVDLVVGAIMECRADVHHWEARQHTAGHHFLQALVKTQRQSVDVRLKKRKGGDIMSSSSLGECEERPRTLNKCLSNVDGRWIFLLS